ncbi:hypothetical protein H4R18_004902 [Coemansia javaensis]|uniref:Uncharacterized protein n=1 Tax=Coemansia javaensis TaxID=2761396 RepID=A0A9W8HAA9_9FUNG|nr:hypothetical protein H4R18_004902 [Coemansia javaensis]
MEARMSQFPLATPAAAAEAHLFLALDRRCLRLDEPSGRSAPLLGHSLLSLVNRDVLDFVRAHDAHRVRQALDAVCGGLAARLVRGPHSAAVGPDAFQALASARLCRRVCPDIGGRVRAHLRTAARGCELFDIDVYAGSVAAADCAVPTLGEAYIVCRIAPSDAPSASGSSALEPAAKRHCGALDLLVAATDGGAAYTPVTPPSESPLTTESPPLASPLSGSPQLGPLPPLSTMLRLLGPI